MNLKEVMSRLTLRQMATADDLWRAAYPDAGKFDEALTDNNFRAVAALVAAKMRQNGSPDATIEDALDVEFDQSDDAGEAPGGDGGEPPPSSPAPGS